MTCFITGIGNISPQRSFENREFPVAPEWSEAGFMEVIPPDYKAYIEPRMLRRMSKILRMGVAAGIRALKDAGIEQPDAVATATALGCTQDTEKFLTDMIQMEEQTLSPTAFIQSTHNTIGGQIALLLGLHGYNMTYTQRGASFESALMDTMMLIESGEAGNVLLGGVEELIQSARKLMQRMGLYRNQPVNNLHLLNKAMRGSMGGEGAAFFVLSSKAENAYAQIIDLATSYKSSLSQLISGCVDFLRRNHLSPQDIDLVISGRNGDATGDGWYDALMSAHFSNVPEAVFKHLCGEYQTATGFAVWLAALAVYNNTIPDYAAFGSRKPNNIRRVLICNHFQERNFSFILVSK